MTDFAAIIDSRGQANPANGWSPVPASTTNATTVQGGPCTVVIEPRIFFRDCVLASLESISPSTRFLAFESVCEWAASDAVAVTDLVILWRAADDKVSDGREDVERQVAEVRRAAPDAPLALMSQHESIDFVQRAMNAGANAFIPTSLGLRATMRVFDLVRGGRHIYPGLLPCQRQYIAIDSGAGFGRTCRTVLPEATRCRPRLA